MRNILCLAAILTLFFTAAVAQGPASTPPFAEPAMSPDGQEIAFVSGGDIWTVAAKGGEARLLISNQDNESRPLYSPDGRYLAFTSTRSGNGDVYTFNFETGNIKRLTYDDAREEVSAWSADGKYIYFSSTGRDISGMNDVFRVKAAGSTPMAVTDDRYTNEFFAMPSPDGNLLAFTARGVASQQWWRKGHSHLDESEIWLRREGKPATYERVTEGGAKNLWPMWSGDAQTLFYVSDRNGNQNLWSQPLKGTAKQLTAFTGGRVLWPSISPGARQIVFERDFKIWKYDIAAGSAAEVKITRRGAAAGPAIEHVRLTGPFQQLALSPDGKKLAFIAHGEVFASPREGGDAIRITNTTGNESQVTWALNSNSLVYISDRDGTAHLFQYNFITSAETRLTNENGDDASPVFSPNGKLLAFVRNGQELHVMDLAAKKETLVAKGYLGRPPFASTGSVVWSPDGKWVAYAGYGIKTFRNIYVVSAAGGESRPVSFLANTFGGGLSWSPNGNYILFSTTQRTENSSVARIDLVPQLPRFTEDMFQQMFTDQQTPDPRTPADPARARPVSNTPPRPDTALTAAAKTTKPAAEAVKIVYEGISQRLSLLPLNADINSQSISKDGKTLLLSAQVGGQQNLYTYSLDETSREPAVMRQLTSTIGFKSDAQFSSDGREVFYLEQGRIQSISLDARIPRPVAVTAELDVDFNKEKTEVFHQAWEVLNKGYYDAGFHGTDWQKVRSAYEPLVAAATTPDELRRLISLMVGELNSSHSGISGPQGSVRIATGRTGLRYDRDEYENNGKLRITEIVQQSPASLSDSIHAGDYVTAIDNTPVTGSINADQLLENKVNRKVVLTLSSQASGADPRKVTIRPVTQATEKGLLYKQWVQQQRSYVLKASGGRLGYVHMVDMSEQALNQLYLDLDAENQAKEGVIVDIRNNNGGFVNAYALDVLTRKGYLTMTGRGLPAAPARTQLGQRTLEAPTILVTNQHSLSDAEDFTEGYRALQLGKVVGEPTGGWIIFTSSAQLIDGSVLRLPFSKITDHEGKDMELHPRPVDIAVTRPIGETYTGKDSQLDAAVKELLRQIDGAKAVKNK